MHYAAYVCHFPSCQHYIPRLHLMIMMMNNSFTCNQFWGFFYPCKLGLRPCFPADPLIKKVICYSGLQAHIAITTWLIQQLKEEVVPLESFLLHSGSTADIFQQYVDFWAMDVDAVFSSCIPRPFLLAPHWVYTIRYLSSPLHREKSKCFEAVPIIQNFY